MMMFEPVIQHTGWGTHPGVEPRRVAQAGPVRGELKVVTGTRKSKSRWSEEKAIEDFLASKSEKIAKRISKLGLRTGIQQPTPAEFVGDRKRKGSFSVGTWNVNKGLLYSKETTPKKGHENLWSQKYREVSELSKVLGLEVLCMQEAGRWDKEGVTEAIRVGRRRVGHSCAAHHTLGV